ncbi:MAG: ABC transporter permease [Euryarchaeota archaeon]|nr:ABC transporter permease [Euryarchaeota archaeon]
MAPGFLIVARQEFLNHLTSRRFVVTFLVVLVLSLVALAQGVGDYQEWLVGYQQQTRFLESSNFSFGGPVSVEKPSGLILFRRMGTLFPLAGFIVAIAMGFDAVTREREERSLVSLLSHPVFRDSVINGKILGSFGALALVVGSVALLSVGLMGIFGVPVGPEEGGRIAFFLGVSLLYLAVFFSIALFTSALSKNSGMSLLYCLLIVFLLSFVTPVARDLAVSRLLGPSPAVSVAPGLGEAALNESLARLQEYAQRVQGVERLLGLISPQQNYERAQNFILDPTAQESTGAFTTGPLSLGQSLGFVGPEVALLALFPIVLFVLSYIAFMRMDIR